VARKSKKNKRKKRKSVYSRASTAARRLKNRATAAGDAADGMLEQANQAGAAGSTDHPRLYKEARSFWLFGEWEKLTALDFGQISQNVQRDRIALLVSTAFHQLGEHDLARSYATYAKAWGCSDELMAQTMIASIANTMGRLQILSGNKSRAVEFFKEAVMVGSTSREIEPAVQARLFREMVALGLLPEAARVLSDELSDSRQQHDRAALAEQRLKILETQVELLHHELSLAQQRQQLYLETGQQQEVLSLASDDHQTPPDPERLKKRSVSQLGQDLWVLEKTGYKRNGFFVEFGATDGVLLSNTYLLEKEFGWEGICIEPNPDFYRALKKNRNCIVLNDCIGARTGEEVQFIYADAYGGMKRHAFEDAHGDKRQAFEKAGKVACLTTISLHDCLVANNAPREIDYISVDTEGSEYEILSTFPFDQWDVKCWTIEHNYTDRIEDIRKLMERNGYKKYEMEWDEWFIRR